MVSRLGRNSGAPVLLLLVIASILSAPRFARASWETVSMGGGGSFNSPVIRGRFRAVGSDLGGVYLSTNNGKFWRPVGSQSGLTATHVSALAFSGWNKIIVGTDDGLFLLNASKKRAVRTWRGRSPYQYVGAVMSSPANEKISYAAVHPGYFDNSPYLLRSSNGGASWSFVADMARSLRVVALRGHPIDINGLWAISGKARDASGPARGYFSPGTAGRTWVRLDPAPTGFDLVDLEYTYDSNNLNRMIATAQSGSNYALYESDETGYSWKRISTSITGVILPNRINPSHWRILQQVHNSPDWKIHQSFNGGSSWTSARVQPRGSHWSRSVYTWGIGSSFQGLLQTIGHYPLKPQLVLWSNPQFIFSSTNYGKTCTNIVSKQPTTDRWTTTGLDNIVPAVIAASPAQSSTVYAGLLDMGLFRSDNGGANWEQLNDVRFSEAWHGFGGNTFTVLPDPVRRKTVWAHIGGDIGTKKPIHLARSKNLGKIGTWTELKVGLPNFLYQLGGLSADPASNRKSLRTLFVTANDNVYKSTNDGNSWSKVLSCNKCHLTFAFKASTIFAGGTGGLWRSTRGGVQGSWVRVTGFKNQASWTSNAAWTDWNYKGLADVCSINDETLWAAVVGDGFYKSVNGGQSFVPVRVDIFARTVAYDPSRGHLYLGSISASVAGVYDENSKGIVRSSNGGRSFTAFNDGLAYKFATQIRIAANGARWAISPGQGIVKFE